MNNRNYKWILPELKTNKNIIENLLEIRGIKSEKDKKEFLNPTFPENISLEEFGLEKKSVNLAIDRIKKAKENSEEVVVYGDYDADGITGTAIMWETLYEYGLKVMPYIPNRFDEGYGFNVESVKKLKEKYPNLKLIITVDHGIVSGDKIEEINSLGIEVILTDHHQPEKELPPAYTIVHSTKICGSAVSWVLARELRKNLDIKPYFGNGLELAGIGTIADQMVLIGPNRSFAKYGLESLNNTKRPGLLCLIKEAGLKPGFIKTFEMNFAIAPRINASGRMSHAMESLQLICTRKEDRAIELAKHLNNVNYERQNLLEEIYKDAREKLKENNNKILMIADEKYNEGIIGLAASRLVEEYYRPVIVLSKNENESKASARSISGFNIIEAIRKLEKLYKQGGGHPMAAGFSIETKNIDEFEKMINENSDNLLTEEVLTRKINIDLKIDFSDISPEVLKNLKKFEPVGMGNPAPVFVVENAKVVDFKMLGKDSNHLKLRLEQGGIMFEAIFFRYGGDQQMFSEDVGFDFVFNLDENTYQGVTTTQLRVKDLRIHGQ